MVIEDRAEESFPGRKMDVPRRFHCGGATLYRLIQEVQTGENDHAGNGPRQLGGRTSCQNNPGTGLRKVRDTGPLGMVRCPFHGTSRICQTLCPHGREKIHKVHE